MNKEYKVFKIENAQIHTEITYVCAKDIEDAKATYLRDMICNDDDLETAIITEFPKERWNEVLIVSNEPTEMPDMTIEQWMKENTPYVWSNLDFSQVICSSEWD